VAVVQRRSWRRVLDRRASQALFALLQEPESDFRKRFCRLVLSWPGHVCSPEEVSGGMYLNIGHTGLDDPGLPGWIAKHRLRAIYFVHDLIPLTHPEYCRAGESARHSRRMDTVLASAAAVIVNSNDTLHSFAELATSRGKAVPPLLAAPLGSEMAKDSPIAGSPHAAFQERPYFVTLGTIEGRKNHLFLLQNWGHLVAQAGPMAPRLLIVGQRGWECEQALDLLDRAERLREYVEELGRCSDEQVARLLKGARALLFPSLAEGYGLPLVEALRLGTPVIASDLPVFHEVSGGVADYLDPLDGPGWRTAILDYATDPSKRREAQLGRLRGYKAPTWSEHFARVEPWLVSL
jgi:glycosyltransferase involved in cell wall biosynthesis